MWIGLLAASAVFVKVRLLHDSNPVNAATEPPAASAATNLCVINLNPSEQSLSPRRWPRFLLAGVAKARILS